MAEKKEMLLVVSKVRAYLKSKDTMMSSELVGALNKKIHTLLDDAVFRCRANRRSTVKSQDI
jgi:histone H3/H4